MALEGATRPTRLHQLDYKNIVSLGLFPTVPVAPYMLIVGTDDGVYRFPDETVDDAVGSATSSAEQLLESGAVMRLRTLPGIDGAFAATATGLYHSPAGDDWTDLGVPTDSVYAVGASADGDGLYAGTRPARVYTAAVPTADDDGGERGGDGAAFDPAAVEWRECEGFQALPSRDDWRLPRHEGLAQVRDVKGVPGVPESVVAAVEVGGVHLSTDRGDTWIERRGDVDPDALQGVDRSDDWSQHPGDVHDDVHELAVVDADEWIAATGFGLFRTTDRGDAWTRLDEGVEQGYFRTIAVVDDTIYTAGALSSSGNWDDPDENPGFYAYDPDSGLAEITYPRPDEVVTGILGVDGEPYAATHRGSLLRRAGGDWPVVASFPAGPDTTGTYTPLALLED